MTRKSTRYLDHSMFVDPDYQTKAELIQAVKDGIEVKAFQSDARNDDGGLTQWALDTSGQVQLKGPHEPAKRDEFWRAVAIIKNGVVVSVE